MSYAAPLELITDASGSVTFGWVDEDVYYARFTRCLSARLGDAFAMRLRTVVQAAASSIKYFGDARALESYDLLARSAFVRVVGEQRSKFESLTLLSWAEGETSPAFATALGGNVLVTKDPMDFELRLIATAPRARYKLGARSEARQRARWPLRR